MWCWSVRFPHTSCFWWSEHKKGDRLTEEAAFVVMQTDKIETYLYVLDNALELRGPLRPGVDQVHGPVKVLHVFTVHLHEWSQFLQDVSDTRVGVPEGNAETKRYYTPKKKDRNNKTNLKKIVEINLTTSSSIKLLYFTRITQ